jgi:exo-beta-1,3-glucanase (GH17 family)
MHVFGFTMTPDRSGRIMNFRNTSSGWGSVVSSTRSNRRRCRPGVDSLERREVLTADSGVFDALTTWRYWIDYAPSYDSVDAPYNANPSEDLIRKDLQALYNEGWRGLVTYTIAGSYGDIPRIAKSVGFDYVIAGIYDPKSSSEIAAASSSQVLPYTDAYVVGNEGIADGRYTFSDMTSALNQVKQATNKPASTSEPGGLYYDGAYATQLQSTGDWLFPNIDYFLWGGQPSTPDQMWNNVSYLYSFLQTANKTSGPVVAKESFFPSAGGPGATEQLQVQWYQKASSTLVNNKPFYFVWGEAFDQPWKKMNVYEPYMGLHRINKPDGTRDPKPVISQLQAVFSGRYGSLQTTTLAKASQRTTPAGKTLLAAAVKVNKLNQQAYGTVQFFAGGTYLGQAQVRNGVARVATAISTDGGPITAVFSGKRRHLRSVGTIAVR